MITNAVVLRLGIVASAALVTFLLLRSTDVQTHASRTRLAPRQASNPTAPAAPPRVVTVAPYVASRVEALELISIELIYAGSAEAELEITLKNVSYRPVGYINFTLGPGRDSWFENVNSQGQLRPLLQPNETKTFTIEASDVEPNSSVIVSGVVFVDESHQGPDEIIEAIRLRRSQIPPPAQEVSPATNRPIGEGN